MFFQDKPALFPFSKEKMKGSLVTKLSISRSMEATIDGNKSPLRRKGEGGWSETRGKHNKGKSIRKKIKGSISERITSIGA